MDGLHDHHRSGAAFGERQAQILKIRAGGRHGTRGGAAGLFGSEAGRAFPTLWGTPWDAVSWHARERIYIQALTEAVALMLPE